MEDLKVEIGNPVIFYEGKTAVVHYSEELKELEDIDKAIALKMVDCSDFMTLYVVHITETAPKEDISFIKKLDNAINKSLLKNL